jgi:hypothetical protein
MQIAHILTQMGGLESMAGSSASARTRRPAVRKRSSRRSSAVLRSRSQPSGVERLGDLLGQLGGGSLMDNVLSPEKRSEGLDSTCHRFLVGTFRIAEKSKIFTLSY